MKGEREAKADPHLNHFGEEKHRYGQDQGNPESLAKGFYVVAVVVGSMNVMMVITGVGVMSLGWVAVGTTRMGFVEVFSLDFMALIGLLSLAVW